MRTASASSSPSSSASLAEPEPEPESGSGAKPEPGTGTAASATATATATAATSAPRLSWLRGAARTDTAGDGTGTGGDGTPPSRISRPMVAAAALGGVVLLAAPFVIGAASRDDGGSAATSERAAGYSGPGRSPDGFVPSAEAPQGKPGTPGGSRSTAPGRAPAGGTASGGNVPGGVVPDGAVSPSGAVADGSGGGEPSGAGAAGKPGTNTAKGGGTGGQPRLPAQQDKQPDTAYKATAAYSGYGGPHCSSTGASYTEYGASKAANDDDEWTTHTGGYAGNGCSGRFRSLPMSGDSGDSVNSALWVFRTGGVTQGTCHVSVYVPADGDIRHVGGDPSYYTLHNGSSGSAAVLSRAEVDQVAHRGQWVALPSVKITGGVLAVKLHDRGKDWNSKGSTDAHHAVDAVRAECGA
ncbi:hypothetical protein [Streptomyces sp. SAT1]|uniref:hypothetical protein n=1 Tax=Streptomyces sp. SAT1 TaxID=1849967 RepID=UPI0013319AF5|nr:hypothetical protein [Streptomyces sp. SAT1]